MHRVMSPTSTKPRYSVAFFNDGALDTVVEAIPTCIPAGERPKYEPLRVEDHLVKRYAQSYSLGPAIIQTGAPKVIDVVQPQAIVA